MHLTLLGGYLNFMKNSKKNKKSLFGANIEPSCSYCQNNSGTNTDIICVCMGNLDATTCKKYYYNPLMRKPQTNDFILSEKFSKEDFSI